MAVKGFIGVKLDDKLLKSIILKIQPIITSTDRKKTLQPNICKYFKHIAIGLGGAINSMVKLLVDLFFNAF